MSPSPPPSKRRRLSLSPTPSSQPFPQHSPYSPPSPPSPPSNSPPPHHLHILSWNANGIAPLIPAHLLSKQHSITSYFSNSTSTSASRTPKPKNLNPGSESSDSDITGNETDARPKLRACLKRWKWPEVVCLQEVKIKPGDERFMGAVRAEVKARPSVEEGAKSKSTRGLGEEGSGGKKCKGKDADVTERGIEETEAEDVGRGYRAFFALPRDKFNARGFGGRIYGIATLVREDLFKTARELRKGYKGDASDGEEGAKNDEEGSEDTVKVTPMPWDTEGRILALSLPACKLLILNVYAVNGTNNPWRSPETGHVLGTRHDKKRAFHSELQAEVRSYEEKGWHVIIAGDLNIARNDLDGWPGRRLGAEHVANRRDFEEKFMEEEIWGLGMVDTFRELMGDMRKYSYRPSSVEWGRSADRVDLVLCSRGMREMVVEADILDSEEESGTSDHCPVYVRVDLGSRESNEVP